MKLVGTTVMLAFVYSLLISAAIGLIVLSPPFDLDIGVVGGLIPLFLFVILVWPASIAAKKLERLKKIVASASGASGVSFDFILS